MDKKKSRTDLLAAGRQKLQQFRQKKDIRGTDQKKDNKGSSSHGKASKKPSKSEQHELNSDTSSPGAETAVPLQVAEGGITSQVDSDKCTGDSLTTSTENKLAQEDDVSATGPSSEPLISEQGDAEAVSDNEADLRQQAVVPEESLESISTEAVNVMATSTSDFTDTEKEIQHTVTSIVVDGSGSPTSGDIVEEERVESEREDGNGEKAQDPLPSHEDIPDFSLIRARGDLVTDEADDLQSEQFAKSLEKADLGMAAVEAKQTSNASDVSVSSAAAYVSEGFSTSLPSQEEGGVNPEIEGQQRDDVADSSNQEKLETSSGTEYGGNNSKERLPAESEGSTVVDTSGEQPLPESILFSDIASHKEPHKTDSLIPPGEADRCSISFLQLIEIVKGLGEDEYEFLRKSRESTSSAELGTSCLLERMEEELYVANSVKDTLQLQLKEQSDLQNEFDQRHSQLLSEISHLRASFSAVQKRNDSLAEELADCRSKLDAGTSSKEKLEIQLLATEAQVEDFSARENELQLKLDRSQQDITSKSMELSEAQGLLTNLQAENETLKGAFSLATDEREKLVEEKESRGHEIEKLLSELADCKNLLATLQVENDKLNGIIGPLTDEKMKLVEEKEHIRNETEKLESDLADCKALVAVQEVENSNLRGTISLLTEEQKKLENNSCLTHEIEKVYLELNADKVLVTALQAEYANLREDLSLPSNERERLEKEKEHLVGDNDRLSAELLLLQERLSTEHVEHTRLAVDLEEAMACLDKLFEENMFLSSTLEVHKAKMRETDNTEAQVSTSVEIPVKSVDSSEVQVSGDENATVLESSDQSPEMQNVKVSHSLEEPFDVSSEFSVLKEHLDKGEKILQNLEKAMEQIQAYSSSLSKSSGKVAAPAVSKLIRAFESKLQLDGHEMEETPLTGDQSEGDPFFYVEGQMRNLRAVLEQLMLDAGNASILFKGVRNDGLDANEKHRELDVQFESLKEYSDILEADNIELGILFETAKQHLYEVEAKNSELGVLCESLKQQENKLREENIEFYGKVCLSRIDGIDNQFSNLQRSSDHITSSIQVQLESLQKESDRGLMLEQELTSSVSQIDETIRRLDEYSLGFCSSISAGAHDGLDIKNRIATSVDVAIKVIKALEKKLEAAWAKHETASNSIGELNVKFKELLEKHELATGILHKVYADLRKLVVDSCGSVDAPGTDMQSLELTDPFNYASYKNLMELVENFLSERLEFQSIIDKLKSELSIKIKDIDELNNRCLDSSSFQKLAEKIEGVIKLENAEISFDETPALYLELLVSVLVEKCKEIDEQKSLYRSELESKEMELLKSQENILQHKTEINVLRESLSQLEESLLAAQSELKEKSTELEQSEQRLSSIREKLSIAVAKGKGLVVQRDNLKQSLAETSAELGRCSEELKLKDAGLLEVEAKLKTYAEAGERVDALESELSYIRNSATALRESFLLKDSLLQRIEEILEDLDLPEHFHSRDILEKVEWLARSATGNSMPLYDWDQKSSVGRSHLDAGFIVSEPWREDVQPSSNSGDDLRIKFEELQGKFYGLAEQNEMLEQSLMQRINLVQRWEELLSRINMPLHLRSMEVEDKIEWLGSALLEATHDRDSLQQKIYDLENCCRSLSTELEASQKQISDVEADFQSVLHEREHLSERLETLISEQEKLSAKSIQLELENGKLQNEVNDIHKKLIGKLGTEEHLQSVEGEMMRLGDLINDAAEEGGLQNLALAGSSESLEGRLRKVIEYYKTSLKQSLVHEAVGNFSEASPADLDSFRNRESLVSEGAPVDEHQPEVAVVNLDEATIQDISVIETPDIASLKKDLEEALQDLRFAREERDMYMEKQQSLVAEVEALDKKRTELQELLNQEEQKSASVREKLNVAVRKGKSLVQQRDSLKQTIAEMSTELDHLKSEINHRENTLAEYEQKIRELASYPARVEVLESECLMLRNSLEETEHLLQERGNNLSLMLNTLGSIDLGDDGNISNPVGKLQQIGKLLQDMHSAMASSEQESRKSRKAAELLLAELNEVQERNDSLQEELSKAAYELQQLSRQKDSAEAAKIEGLSHLEKLSTVHKEERRKQYFELMALRTSVNKLRNAFSDINDFLADVFSNELEFLQSLEANLESCVKQSDANLVGWPHLSTTRNFVDMVKPSRVDSWPDINLNDISSDNDIIDICGSLVQGLDEFMIDISVLKEKVSKHSVSWHEQVNTVSKGFETFFKSIGKEKDLEIDSLHEQIALLHGACANIFVEIENKKTELVGNKDLKMNLNQATVADSGIPLGKEDDASSIKSMVDRLSLAVKGFVKVNTEMVERNQKEMKTIISNLQRELQEKDIQNDRICLELVGQIKETEATARNYAADLQSVSVRMHDLEKQLKLVERERNSLDQRVKLLQDGQASAAELQQKVKSLGDLLAAKEQEIEALMQALDEEENQMEDLTNKTKELEQKVQQKNVELQNVEASRGKIAKKLSVTVSKFDELHHLSENLLAEVEKLQQQLQDRDAEISLLRQEVTRCTNEVLVASQMNNKRDSDEIQRVLSWFDTIASLFGLQDLHPDDKSDHVHHYMEALEEKIASVISELEDLRLVGQSKDALLETERSKVAELRQREETLEKILHERKSQTNMSTGSTSEIVEVEPVINKWTVRGTSIPSQVRSLRKGNNDQVAITIDADQGDNSSSLEEDDDKAHGFKSLSASRIVPRLARRVTDMVDGLWVSCDRTLMRQPALRLGIMMYWAILHALLAAFVV